jgi:pyruvate dehydrogenase (quinone)
MTNVADIIVSVLADAGVQRCYGVPGDTLNYFTDALRRQRKIRFVHVRHEEAGGFAAGAEALLTGELAACAGSCGPGSLHFINGLLDAQRSRAPVVLIASQVMRDELGSDFPQEVDFRSIYASACVYCEEVRTPANARRLAVAAAQAALVRRGVAVLIVPSDVFAAKAPDQPPFTVHRPRPITVPGAKDLARMAELLNAGRNITIYGGSGCAAAHDQVVALARRLNAPVAYTSRAKDFLEHDNPFAVGMTGVFGVEGGFRAVTECDTLLLLGCDFAWRQFYPPEATIVQVDIDGTHLGRRHPISLGVMGDVGPTLDALSPLIEARDDEGFLTRMLDATAQAQARLDRPALADGGTTIHPQHLAELIGLYAKPDAIFTADGGTPMVWLLRHVPANGCNRTVLSLTHGTMANAMPNALGAAAAFEGRQVIAMSGDGGLAMLLGDLLTAVQEQLPIKVAVFNNGTLGFVELEQKVEGLLDAYTGLQNPDFGQVAEAMGLWGRRVDNAADLEDAIEAWLSAPGPALLDVVVDRFELVMPPHVQSTMLIGAALYTAKAVLKGRAKDAVKLAGAAWDSL